MATPRQTRPGGPKGRAGTDPALMAKTRKRAPSPRQVTKETRPEKTRRLLVEQLRKLQTVSARAAFDKAAFLRHEDVVGLLIGLHVSPPTKLDPQSGEKVVDGRALNAQLRILRALGASIDAMREERQDAPDSIDIRVTTEATQDEPDVPVYADDAAAGEADARAVQR